MARLGDIATYINGYAFKPTDWADSGLPIIRIQDLTGNSYQANRYDGKYDPKYEVVDGDVLISWSASLGIYVWHGEKALLNQHIFKVVFDKADVDKDFFIHQVKSVLEKAASAAHGATMKHLTKPVFDALPFYLPSKEKQKEIAAKLNRVVALIECRESQLAQLDLLVKSRFIELFGDCVVNPRGWKTRCLEDIAEVGSSKRVFVEELKEFGIPFYRGTEIGALAEGKRIKPELFVTPDHYESLCEATGRPMIGDLLMPSICPDGRIWVVNSDEPFYFKDGRVLWVHSISDDYNPIFLLYTLKNRIMSDYKGIASGTTFAELKIFALKKCRVFDVPLTIQNEFAAFVEQTDKLKLAVTEALTELETLKKSLMQQYFG